MQGVGVVPAGWDPASFLRILEGMSKNYCLFGLYFVKILVQKNFCDLVEPYLSLDHWRLNEIHRSTVSTDGLNSKSIIWAAILKLLNIWFFTEFVDVLWNFSPFINIESFESCFLPPHSPRRSPSVSFHYIIHTQSKILSPASETTFETTLWQLSYFRQKDTTWFTVQVI